MRRMFYFSFALVCAAWLSPLGAMAQSPRYTGSNSSEAILRFHHHVEFLSEDAPTETDARRKINAQLAHLFGTMGSAPISAVPRGNQIVSNIEVRTKKDGEYSASYDYEGKIVVKYGATNSYSVVLPTHPDDVYERAIVWNGEQPSYPCTDAHYKGKEAFWYYWSPYRSGCRLVEGVDYLRVTGSIERIENTKSTYPEYARLVNDSTGIISIHVFLGMNASQGSHPNPNNTPDVNAPNYRAIRSRLLKSGFNSNIWSQDQIEAVSGQTPVIPYVEELEKQTAHGTIRVRMFYGPTGLWDHSGAFHYFLKDALENGSVMLYGGHSGFGSNLNLNAIEQMEGFKITVPKDRYQIMFFNSCSSYPYYATDYFGRKKSDTDPEGTYNLDILTNGLETYFSVMGNTNATIIEAIDAWATGFAVRSYQQIAQAIDSNNLFGVNGDEDNPTNP